MNVDFLQLFNIVARIAKPVHLDLKQAESLNDKFEDLGVDSLDGLVIGMYLFELYGIEEEKEESFHPETVGEFYEFLITNKTKEPKSIEEAREQIQ